jgi:uncharacterized membrane protein YgcG
MKTAPQYWILRLCLAFVVVWTVGVANAQDSNGSQAIFKSEQLHQMLAPVALYPDALLSQILMASTYPGNVADAVVWSKANPKMQGDAAVKAVSNQPWDPSVQSLVAFPEVMAQMGQHPDWVQNVGDAFLAQPEDVMAAVQSLRAQASQAGNLKSNEQQTVVQQQSAGTTVIEIEPANPEIVYVPSYNPTVVYGAWAYPAYPPSYWAPLPGYYHPVATGIAAGIAFGVGIGIANSLWGGFNWGHGDVNVNVNRYNNINANNRISGNGNVNWNHNAQNRRGTPYADNRSRQQFNPGVGGADKRQGYRGDNPQRGSSRDNAMQSFNRHTNNGGAANPRNGTNGAGGNLSGRNGVSNTGSNLSGRTGANNANGNYSGRTGSNYTNGNYSGRTNADRSSAGRPSTGSNGGARNNAFNGVQSPSNARTQSNRGQSSTRSMNSSGGSRGGGGGRPVSRPAPSRGGGRRH